MIISSISLISYISGHLWEKRNSMKVLKSRKMQPDLESISALTALQDGQ